MKIGMMWMMEKNNLPLSAKIQEAITYYQKKYGTYPTMIMVNPKDYVECAEFAIETSKSIRVNHIWLGMEEIK